MSVKSLDLSEVSFVQQCAYNKAFSWAVQLNFPMFSLTVDTVTSFLDGWLVNGTMTIPGSEIVGYSVAFRRKPNGRVGGCPITVIYRSDLF